MCAVVGAIALLGTFYLTVTGGSPNLQFGLALVFSRYSWWDATGGWYSGRGVASRGVRPAWRGPSSIAPPPP